MEQGELELDDAVNAVKASVRPQAEVMNDPWKHRSQKTRCSTCMWFVVKVLPQISPPGPPTQALGRCRRHAPELGGFPAVFTTDWCGDHKLDETKLGDQ